MIIYNDLITGDELFSDAYPMTEVQDGMMYRLKGKNITEKVGGADINIGANPSAEGGDDEGAAEDASISGINIVIAHRLVEVPYDKKSFQKCIKEWCGKVLDKLKESKPERAVTFKEKMPECVKAILKDFSEYQFFVGENMDPDGGPVLVKWEDNDPIMYVFKDGVTETKY